MAKLSVKTKREMAQKVKWLWDWSPERKRAFIVDWEGFVVVGPVLSKKQAMKLVRDHNMAVRWAQDEIEELVA